MAMQVLAVNRAKVYVVGRTEEKLEIVAGPIGKGIAGQFIQLPGVINDMDNIKRLDWS